jgi:hypothetical protein
MPNDCWSYLTITFKNIHEYNVFLQNEIKDNINIKNVREGKQGLQLRLWSAWVPDFDLLEIYIVKYPSIWIKNEWKEEGGKAGVWVGYENVIKRFEWNDLCLEEESFFLGQANSN